MKVSCFTVGALALGHAYSRIESIASRWDGVELRASLSDIEAQLEYTLANLGDLALTHAHVDHAGSLRWLQEAYDVPTYLGRLERPLFEALPQQGDWFGMPMLNRPCGRIDHWVDDGFELALGESRLRFFSTPGHTPGQGCWIANGDDIIVGDTIFAGSIGRTDFPMSSPRAMRESLHRLMSLPLHLRVHSGHGPVTTLGEELATNPFLGEVRRARVAAQREHGSGSSPARGNGGASG